MRARSTSPAIAYANATRYTTLYYMPPRVRQAIDGIREMGERPNGFLRWARIVGNPRSQWENGTYYGAVMEESAVMNRSSKCK